VTKAIASLLADFERLSEGSLENVATNLREIVVERLPAEA
jgi:hypothetical protein